MPLSPSFTNTRFTNPFSTTPHPTSSAFTTPQARSTSAASTNSTNSFHSTNSSFSGLDSILSAKQQDHVRNNSIASINSISSRRPSCFSIVEAEEERAEFGEDMIALLEPRDSVGWWGVRQVLEESVKKSLC